MVKIIDISLIADRSLDIYCASVANEHHEPLKGHVPKRVASFVGKIFANVMDDLLEKVCLKYDKVFITVPCYPITRLKSGFMMTRFVCRHTDMLSGMGVSSNHFQEFFEKFISLKCVNEYITKLNDNTYILNGRGVLSSDWVKAIKDVYGSSLVDDSIPSTYETNPKFIVNMEEVGPERLTETEPCIEYKLKEIIKATLQP